MRLGLHNLNHFIQRMSQCFQLTQPCRKKAQNPFWSFTIPWRTSFATMSKKDRVYSVFSKPTPSILSVLTGIPHQKAFPVQIPDNWFLCWKHFSFQTQPTRSKRNPGSKAHKKCSDFWDIQCFNPNKERIFSALYSPAYRLEVFPTKLDSRNSGSPHVRNLQFFQNSIISSHDGGKKNKRPWNDILFTKLKIIWFICKYRGVSAGVDPGFGNNGVPTTR